MSDDVLAHEEMAVVKLMGVIVDVIVGVIVMGVIGGAIAGGMAFWSK